MKNYYTMDEIRVALSDRVISIVAKNTGIHQETLYNIAKNRQKGMQFRTYEILVNYLFSDK